MWRLSPRLVQYAWRTWQQKPGFDRLYPFHAIRPSAVTSVYRRTRDLFLARRFAKARELSLPITPSAA